MTELVENVWIPAPTGYVGVTSGANLSGANLRWADLSGDDLSGANLAGANLSDANLSGANLRWADLSGANLAGANLTSANLPGADLSGADLTSANLAGADLSDANLSGAKWHSGIIISRVPLQIYGLPYQVTLLDQHMQIGCELHPIGEWRSFDDERIASMDGAKARRFWKQWKEPLLAMAAADGRGEHED